ncbi:hypothetical protein Nepgr_016625 [Nepenthes gracilis]|uniref:Cytochrome P450 n=1 Tax=Nepenthes gracilis TaxID=150966 RepID=A0AAD3SQ14_NEPGR|nr:hypothetical protein Nepgr_016625 [Nepenthes gracilis]
MKDDGRVIQVGTKDLLPENAKQTVLHMMGQHDLRYGEIFKTHILGYPCIMLASPEAARFVLLTKASLFKPTYPKSKERLIGAAALFYQQGPCHSRLRKLVQASLSLDKIQRLIPKIEAIVTSALHSWSGGRVVHTFHELKKLTFEVAILVIFGNLNCKCKEKLKENYYILDRGYNSFPTKIPGTKYYKSALARQRLGCLIKEIVRERLSTKRLSAKNLLDCLLSFREESGKMLTDDHVVDNVIGVLFAAQDTTASLFTWVLKYITDKDKLLEAIKEEQKNIHEFNDQGLRPLTWAQTRSTPVTNKVILETLRMASIISFTYREATEDVIYDGQLA